ncbi:hypothetical protein Poly30_25850 [Planctomycetes bacterium Poly30]|uniref:Uncharacterized protein n=1 Tax=Saltatorellus ferox TaxID=2528018 RepID=A0A518ESJ9_9BACT|nr:hypothetical protein Poly30_25850 [Planctomycetes bacterium Poly30]
MDWIVEFSVMSNHVHLVVVAESWLLRTGWTKGGQKGLLTIHDLPRVTGALQA